MKAVAYASPWVPPEWIAAHGLKPRWLPLVSGGVRMTEGIPRGMCPFAAATVATVLKEEQANLAAVVLTTTCDQIRRAADEVHRQSPLPVFLLNVPATWRSPAAAEYFQSELERLGRFLVEVGGRSSEDGGLAETILDYARARKVILAHRERLSARQLAEALARVRSGELGQGEGRTSRQQESLLGAEGSFPVDAASRRVPLAVNAENGRPASTRREAASTVGGPSADIRLALVGGPLRLADADLLDFVEGQGARIVLDASEGGERMLPSAPDVDRLGQNPRGELARMYFDRLLDVFRRPNTPLYAWLAREIAARGVQGILFRRYLWCDLWHAELYRMRETLGVPILEIDVVDGGSGLTAAVTGRFEAFAEMLR